MSWLRKINFHVNWETSKWRLRDDFESSLTNRFVKNNKQESKSRLIKIKEFYIAQMSWNELQFDLSKSKAFAFAILLDQKTSMNCIQNDVVKIENNERIINEISFQYTEFQDIFSKINAYKFFEYDSQNHVIKILFDYRSFFDSIYNLFAAKLKILKTYIDEYMKKSSSSSSCRLRILSYSSSRNQMTSFIYV
jgi:hypothetical protein